jgi:hypothetical protein
MPLRRMSPGCKCCPPPPPSCANATLTVNVKQCDNTTNYSGRTVTVKNGATTVATGTTNASGQATFSLPAATCTVLPVGGGIIYTVEVAWASGGCVSTDTFRACCGGSGTLNFQAPGLCCPPTIFATAGTLSGLGTSASISGLTADLVTPTSLPTRGCKFTNGVDLTNGCTLDCANQVDLIVTFNLALGRCSATLSAAYRTYNCGGASVLLERLAGVGDPGCGCTFYGTYGIDNDTVTWNDAIGTTTLTFTLDLSAVGLGSAETFTVGVSC